MSTPETWVHAHLGDFPVVLTAPHSGRHEGNFEHRAHGVFCDDDFTKELLWELMQAMKNEHGVTPYTVRTRLKRIVCEMNRSSVDSNNGIAANAVHKYYHSCIEHALQDCISSYGFAVLLDLHGQMHRPCTELGYAITLTQLNHSTDTVIDSLMPDQCTIASASAIQKRMGRLHMRNNSSFVRGESSIGTRLCAMGWRAVPSQAEPTIDTMESEIYFWGAYTVKQYSTRYPEHVMAIQVESPHVWRVDSVQRKEYASALASAIVSFIRDEFL